MLLGLKTDTALMVVLSGGSATGIVCIPICGWMKVPLCYVCPPVEYKVIETLGLTCPLGE